jgi:adenylyltransferase/sulfurtransferase
MEAVIEQKTSLSKEEISRYSRHLILSEVGMDGQLKLKQSSVLVIGTGGLGSPLVMYLAAAGIGTIGMVDFDVVDYTNLQRQIIHSTDDVGRSKLQSAAETVRALNPHVQIETHEQALDSSNALEIMQGYDIIVDCTDNFPTRYLTNDAAVMLGIPYVYGSIFRFEGQVTVFNYEDGPCYRCLYEQPPPPGLVPSCSVAGVLGVLPGIIGTIQANEVIKIILGEGELLSGRLLLLDALDMKFKELKLRKNPNCVVCGDNPTQNELIDYEEFCGVDTNTIPMFSPEFSTTVEELEELMRQGIEFQLVDVREPQEQKISKIEGSILIPQNTVEDQLDKLEKEMLTIVHCKTGIRSARVVAKLKDYGFTNVKNLIGGINAYARKVDTDLPIY